MDRRLYCAHKLCRGTSASHTLPRADVGPRICIFTMHFRVILIYVGHTIKKVGEKLTQADRVKLAEVRIGIENVEAIKFS